MMMSKMLFVIALISVVAVGPSVFPVQAAEPLAFSALEDSGPQEVAKIVLREAYGRIGINIEFYDLPGERALIESNAGRTDGEVARISGIEHKYSNLVKVPIPVSQLDGVAFSKKHDFNIDGWNSLNGYSIGAFSGSKFVENNTVGKDVIYTRGIGNLFLMLEQDRLDMIVIPYLSGLDYIKKNSLIGYKAMFPPLATIKLYHYLNQKHVMLLSRITKALASMEKEGRIESIRNEYVVQLQASN